MKEIHSVEEMAQLAPGTRIVNRFRLPGYIRNKYGRQDDKWTEVTWQLRIKEGGAPYLYGKRGTHHKVKPSDFSEDDRWFIAEGKKSAR